MQKRIINVGLQGMNQDVINPQVNSKQAYEIKNFRINSTGHSNGIELTSEKGTLFVPLYSGGARYNDYNDYYKTGIEDEIDESQYEIIGYSVLNDWLVLFVTGSYTDDQDIEHKDDQILKMQYDGGFFKVQRLYRGNLNFDTDHRIEAIPCYESEKIQKIYWIDGKNYPRVINIAKEGGYIDFGVDEDPFSFYQKISDGQYNTINVTKSYVGGLFYAGVIQYAFSFYNLNAQETPIIYTTPLNYVSHSDRGEQPNKQLGCAFQLQLLINKGDAQNFDYVRVYSIYRTSLNGTPVVKVIKDIKCSLLEPDDEDDFCEGVFVDTNEGGYDFDAYRILINSDHIKPNAIAHKDVKLFLGNYESDSIPENPFVSGFSASSIQIEWKVDSSKQVDQIDSVETKFYQYINQDRNDSNTIRTFKKGEYYKLGLQFQDKYGNWSQPYFIRNSQNDKYPSQQSNGKTYLPYARSSGFTIADLYEQLSDYALGNYVNVRPVASFPTENERLILCQGIVNPTVFNAGQRYDKTCVAQSSWFFRPFSSNINQSSDHNVGFVQNGHHKPLLNSTDFRGEMQNMYFDITKTSGETIPATTGYTSQIGFEHGESSLPPFGDSNVVWLNNEYYTIGGVGGICYKYDDEPAKIESQHTISQNGSTIGCEYSLVVYKFENSINWSSPESSDAGQLLGTEYHTYYYLTQSYTPSSHDGERPMISYDQVVSNSEIDKYRSFYYVDQKYVTLNSPDIEFNNNSSNVDLSQYKFRTIGRVDFKNVAARYNIIAESPLFLNNGEIDNNGTKLIRSAQLAHGFYDKTHSYYTQQQSQYRGGRMLSVGQVWLDDICNIFTYNDLVGCGWNDKDLELLYFVYPWQRQYLNNFNGNKYVKFGQASDSDAGVTEESETSKIIRKVLSNNRYCDTVYTSSQALQFDTIRLYNSQETALVKLDDQEFYYGNVDQLVTCSSQYNGWRFDYQDGDQYSSTSSSGHTVHWSWGKKTGYPIVIGKRIYSGKYDSNNNGFYVNIDSINDGLYGRVLNDGSGTVGTRDCTPSDHSQDPILVRYKSTPHIVCKLRNEIQEDQGYSSSSFGYLYLGEIYKETSDYSTNTAEFDLQNRTWVPCGKPQILSSENNNTIDWIEGDTFFQRYDCLKTYPFSNDDYQSVVEIASFMVETHVNLDGRYDQNRGLVDNTFVNPTNFNLINDVYSQSNNFFQYNILDKDRFNVDIFPTRLTWSLNKVNNQEIDEWTRTNTAAFMDLDGDKGQISSLRRFNNQIYAFQESGISRIKYNENVAINASNGTPIELGNSASVNGKDYLSETIGSQNKWSCISTPNGIFFVDNNTAGIYSLSIGQGGGIGLHNMTRDVLQRWFESNNSAGFVNTASYDANMDEVLFTYGNSTEQSLSYQNRYGVFSAFYDYQGWIDNIGKHSFNIHNNKIWFLRENSSYNSFYGITKPYWVSFVANAQSDVYNPVGCIYDNVWYNADVLSETGSTNINYDELIGTTSDVIPNFSSNSGWYETFNKIEVGNDYQYASSTEKQKFIKKFRMWRVPVPRQDRTRMRNPWLRVRMENMNPSTDKMILRNIIVDSFY